MGQIELNTVKTSIKSGKVANTYLLVGSADSDVLGCSFELIKSIIKSPYSGLEIPQQQASLEKLKSLTNPDIHYFYPVNTTKEIKRFTIFFMIYSIHMFCFRFVYLATL